jgi:hypothetical protein
VKVVGCFLWTGRRREHYEQGRETRILTELGFQVILLQSTFDSEEATFMHRVMHDRIH